MSTIGLDEENIRKYVAWQEKQEKQLEAIQGKLFDKAFASVGSHLPGVILQAAASGGGS